jgi:hypothetical protein
MLDAQSCQIAGNLARPEVVVRHELRCCHACQPYAERLARSSTARSTAPTIRSGLECHAVYSGIDL